MKWIHLNNTVIIKPNVIVSSGFESLFCEGFVFIKTNNWRVCLSDRGLVKSKILNPPNLIFLSKTILIESKFVY